MKFEKDKFLINKHHKHHENNLLKAIETIPEGTIAFNGKKVIATYIDETKTNLFELSYLGQLNIPKKAKNIENFPDSDSKGFEYESLKYFFCFEFQ